MTDLLNSPADGTHCGRVGQATLTSTETVDPQTSERWELAIAGMTCGRCVSAVRDVLHGLAGVEVDHVRIGRALIRVEPATVSPAAVIASIRDAGYRASFDLTSGTSTEAAASRVSAGGSCCASR